MWRNIVYTEMLGDIMKYGLCVTFNNDLAWLNEK